MSSLELLSSEQTQLVELSFSDEDSRTVGVLGGTEDFELASQEFYLIPMICTYLDDFLKNIDLNEVMRHSFAL